MCTHSAWVCLTEKTSDLYSSAICLRGIDGSDALSFIDKITWPVYHDSDISVGKSTRSENQDHLPLVFWLMILAHGDHIQL